MFVVYYPVRFSYPFSRPPFLFVHFHVYDLLPLCTKGWLGRCIKKLFFQMLPPGQFAEAIGEHKYFKTSL